MKIYKDINSGERCHYYDFYLGSIIYVFSGLDLD